MILAFSALLILGTVALPKDSSAQLFGVQFRAFSGQFQQFLDLDPDGSVARVGPVFSLLGGVFGLGFIGSTLYGTELDPNNVDWFLVTIPHTGLALGARVGVSPIGFPNVEGLTYCSQTDKLYGSSFDFATHLTTFIEVNPATGVGSSIGTMSFDVFIVGLACSPDGTLYGISKAFGSPGLPPTLYTINKITGAETPIGELGLATIPPGFGPLEGLAWDSGKLIASFEKLHEINITTGAASLIGGDYTTTATGDGVYGLASLGSTVDVPGEIPSQSRLRFGPAIPNPFSPLTTLSYSLAEATRVRLTIYSTAGRLVAKLVDGMKPAGRHSIQWDGRDLAGNEVPAGVYLVVLQARGDQRLQKVVRTR